MRPKQGPLGCSAFQEFLKLQDHFGETPAPAQVQALHDRPPGLVRSAPACPLVLKQTGDCTGVQGCSGECHAPAETAVGPAFVQAPGMTAVLLAAPGGLQA